MTNKERYAAFCQAQPEMPVMMQPWWLEAVCAGKQWDVMLLTKNDLDAESNLWQRIKARVRKRSDDAANAGNDEAQAVTAEALDPNEEIVAAMPYLLRKRLWYKFIIMPQMTPFGGVWMNEELFGSPELQEKLAKAIARKLREMHLAYYYQKFPVGNPLPYWLGKRDMKIEERVTYRINELPQIEAVEDGYSQNKKRQLRKAEGLEVDYDMTAEEFYRFHTACIAERGKKLSYTREFLLVLEKKARRAGQCAIIRVSGNVAENGAHGTNETEEPINEHGTTRKGTEQTLAAAFVVWDKRYLYYLIPAYLPSAAKSGASARLADEAIRLAKEKGLQFDFEGGNDDEGIANHYRQFGSKAVQYQSVSKLYRPSFVLLLWVYKWWEKRRF